MKVQSKRLRPIDSQWVLSLKHAEAKAIYEAVERDGRGELVSEWMLRVLLERANGFNLTFTNTVTKPYGAFSKD